MPNHVHGIIVIDQPDGGGAATDPVTAAPVDEHDPAGNTPNPVGAPIIPTTRSGQPQGLPLRVGDVVGAYKSLTTAEYVRGVTTLNWPLFERRLW